MEKSFSTLDDLLVNILESHIDSTKIDKILTNQELIKGSLAKLIEGQSYEREGLKAIVLVAGDAGKDLLAIKAFLRIPDARIFATQDQLNKLGSQLRDNSDAAKQFDQTIPDQTIPEAVKTETKEQH